MVGLLLSHVDILHPQADRRLGSSESRQLRPAQIVGAFFVKWKRCRMIHVIAIVTTKPGQRDSVLQLFRANSPNVRAETGCIEYGATIDLEPALGVQTPFGPDSFVVIERWENAESLPSPLQSTAHNGIRGHGERLRGKDPAFSG
jgi:quinol monooxygenase YgiN